MEHAKALESIELLIFELGGSTDNGTKSRGPSDLLLEHLEAARRNLLGSRSGEYDVSLQQAQESTSSIFDKRVRVEFKKKLKNLIGS